jgi:hypothetical protein
MENQLCSTNRNLISNLIEISNFSEKMKTQDYPNFILNLIETSNFSEELMSLPNPQLYS